MSVFKWTVICNAQPLRTEQHAIPVYTHKHTHIEEERKGERKRHMYQINIEFIFLPVLTKCMSGFSLSCASNTRNGYSSKPLNQMFSPLCSALSRSLCTNCTLLVKHEHRCNIHEMALWIASVAYERRVTRSFMSITLSSVKKRSRRQLSSLSLALVQKVRLTGCKPVKGEQGGQKRQKVYQ